LKDVAGLKINFDKSEVMLIGGDCELSLAYSKIFNCNIGMHPVKYLEVLISAGRLNSSLSNTAISHMSMFLIPKMNIERMDMMRRKSFWQGGRSKKEISFG
jgi:hypothetical protein